MTHHFHAVVWMDHREARIYGFGQGDVTEHLVRPPDQSGNIHHKSGTVGAGHTHESKPYLTEISNALLDSQEILILGHGNAKTELAHFIRDHVPALASKILGVETMNQPTKGEIVAYAKQFFDRKDRTTPQR